MGGVGDQGLQLRGVAGGDADGMGPGVHRLAGEEFGVASAGAECHDLETAGRAVDDVNRLRADGTCGPEDDYFARLHWLKYPALAAPPWGTALPRPPIAAAYPDTSSQAPLATVVAAPA